jgi:hypothetical protein
VKEGEGMGDGVLADQNYSYQINLIPVGNSCPANLNGFKGKYFQ